MALVKCPECGKEVSSLANTCIGCGFPIKEYVEQDTFKKGGRNLLQWILSYFL